MIVINADDFGLNDSKSNAIIEAFSKGLISSTTMEVNQESFDGSVELAHKQKLLS